jgi:hypothetical protein
MASKYKNQTRNTNHMFFINNFYTIKKCCDKFSHGFIMKSPKLTIVHRKSTGSKPVCAYCDYKTVPALISIRYSGR